MNDLEQNLRDMRLAAPSAAFDRRIDETLTPAAAPRHSPRPATPWWLLAVAACGIATVFLLVSPWPRSPSSERIVYRIEAKGRLRQLLLEAPAGVDLQPHLTIKGNAP
jgi:hypothetical protein